MRAARFAVLAAAIAALTLAAYLLTLHRAPAEPRVAVSLNPSLASASAPVTASASPSSVPDPLSSGRPPSVDQTRGAVPGNWVTARPGFQYSRTASERGGIEPCATRAADQSAFQPWTPIGQGHFTAPSSGALDASGHFDLIIHLEGDGPVLRELEDSQQLFVLYTLTLDVGKSYAPSFTAQGYESLVSAIEQALSKQQGRPAHAGHVALSAWSAGFSGIEAALAQPVTRDIDAVILVDALHAPRGNDQAFKAQLKPFVDYAARAANGERFMFVSHSSIDPPNFASTTECAHYLTASLGGTPQAVRRSDALGLELVELFDRGEFHVRGYAGNDKADHCAQLALLKDAYSAVGRRWTAPRAH